MQDVITVTNLCKNLAERQSFPGVLGALKGLFYGKTTIRPAIKDLSFTIKQGERVAFIGPNGAGSTIRSLWCRRT